MKAEINFYQKSLRPKRDLMPLLGVIILWLIALLIMIIFWLGFAVDILYQNSVLKKQQQHLAAQQAVLNLSKNELAKKQDKSKLVAEFKRLQAEVSHKQLFFDYLTTTERLVAIDFSQVMQDLAQFHEANIWLTSIQLSDQQIILKGETQQPSALPVWLSQLKHSSFFTGKEFSVVEFKQNKQNSEFVVATEIDLTFFDKGQSAASQRRLVSLSRVAEAGNVN